MKYLLSNYSGPCHTHVKIIMLSQVVNNLFTVVQNRLQQCCAAPCQQGLLTILFTLVRTMLLTPDEPTRPEQCCWNNANQPDIIRVLRPV